MSSWARRAHTSFSASARPKMSAMALWTWSNERFCCCCGDGGGGILHLPLCPRLCEEWLLLVCGVEAIGGRLHTQTPTRCSKCSPDLRVHRVGFLSHGSVTSSSLSPSLASSCDSAAAAASAPAFARARASAAISADE